MQWAGSMKPSMLKLDKEIIRIGSTDEKFLKQIIAGGNCGSVTFNSAFERVSKTFYCGENRKMLFSLQCLLFPMPVHLYETISNVVIFDFRCMVVKAECVVNIALVKIHFT